MMSKTDHSHGDQASVLGSENSVSAQSLTKKLALAKELVNVSGGSVESVGQPGASDNNRIARGNDPRAKHVAIIMDGNGRWAAAKGLPRSAGHRAGVDAARRAVEAARDLGMHSMTLYSFSTENWRRPAGEVRDLMALLREFIGEDLPKLKKNNVKVRIIGDKEKLDLELRLLVNRAERETANNNAFLLQIAFNYGGRDEIRRAALRLAEDIAAGRVEASDVDEEAFSRCLDTAGTPDPDFVIRTSGEQRISNFLLWQAAYAEYVFTDVLWPDFDEQTLVSALAEFSARERRYGGLGEQDKCPTQKK